MSSNDKKKKIIGGRRFFKVGRIYETIKTSTAVQESPYKDSIIYAGLLNEETVTKGSILVLLSMPSWVLSAGKTRQGYQVKILCNKKIQYLWLPQDVSPKEFLKQIK